MSEKLEDLEGDDRKEEAKRKIGFFRRKIHPFLFGPILTRFTNLNNYVDLKKSELEEYKAKALDIEDNILTDLQRVNKTQFLELVAQAESHLKQLDQRLGALGLRGIYLSELEQLYAVCIDFLTDVARNPDQRVDYRKEYTIREKRLSAGLEGSPREVYENRTIDFDAAKTMLKELVKKVSDANKYIEALERSRDQLSKTYFEDLTLGIPAKWRALRQEQLVPKEEHDINILVNIYQFCVRFQDLHIAAYECLNELKTNPRRLEQLRSDFFRAYSDVYGFADVLQRSDSQQLKIFARNIASIGLALQPYAKTLKGGLTSEQQKQLPLSFFIPREISNACGSVSGVVNVLKQDAARILKIIAPQYFKKIERE